MSSYSELSPARLRAACNRSHARTRAYERYGLNLTMRDITDIEEKIASNHPDCVPLKQDLVFANRLHYAVRIESDMGYFWCPVIYDQATISLPTFLPIETLDQYRETLPVAEKSPWQSQKQSDPSTDTSAHWSPLLPRIPKDIPAADHFNMIDNEYQRILKLHDKAKGLWRSTLHYQMQALTAFRKAAKMYRKAVESGAESPDDEA